MPTRSAASLRAERIDRWPKPVVSSRLCRISTEEHPPGEERRRDAAPVPSRFCQPRLNTRLNITSGQPASRLPRVRHTCSEKRGQLTESKINRDYVFL